MLATWLVGELRRERDVPERHGAAGGGAARSRRAAARRDRLAVPRAACRTAVRPTEPAFVLDTLRARGRRAARIPKRSARPSIRAPTRRSRHGLMHEPRSGRCAGSPSEPRARTALPARRQPARRDRPARRARADDVALEIGAGRRNADRPPRGAGRARHAVEIDRRLEPALAEVLAAHRTWT